MAAHWVCSACVSFLQLCSLGTALWQCRLWLLIRCTSVELSVSMALAVYTHVCCARLQLWSHIGRLHALHLPYLSFHTTRPDTPSSPTVWLRRQSGASQCKHGSMFACRGSVLVLQVCAYCRHTPCAFVVHATMHACTLVDVGNSWYLLTS
jgi:hypothetical protein